LDQIDHGTGDWPDDGCPIWPHCLRCPIVHCVYDMPETYATALAAALGTFLRRAAREPIPQILRAEGISLRTYYRRIAAARAALRHPP
ncbi:MAG: hypothetical protein AB7R89_24050, partial [Dehalococcoidia bacterium]